MKLWQIAIVSTSLGFALPALAQMAAKAELRSDVEARVKDRLGKLDADKDGTVTREEMTAFADARSRARDDAAFVAMDTDHNGTISRAEFDAFHAKGHASTVVQTSNGDGTKVRVETRRMAMRGDGPDGMMPPPPPPSPDGKPHVRMMMMDRDGAMTMADGDGRIVIADAVKKALARFDAIDTNKDGTISPEERKAGRDALRGTTG